MSFYPVRVTKRRELTSEIAEFTLERDDGSALPAYSAGAHIDVRAPNGVVRQYSLCGDCDDLGRYEIAVLYEQNSSGGSRSIWQEVKVGDLIDIGHPRNLFSLASESQRVWLFAGGIGITPILAMSRALHKANIPFELHYASRSASQCAFAADLRDCLHVESIHFYHDDEGRRIDFGRLLDAPTADVHVYVCGPSGFIQAVIDAAARAGFPDTQVHREVFSAAEMESDGNEAFEVEIASTGEVLAVPADRTLAAVLIGHGLPLMVSCEQGVCGTCMTTVISGEPDHRDSVLTQEDRERGDTILPCCSRSRANAPRLVLDL